MYEEIADKLYARRKEDNALIVAVLFFGGFANSFGGTQPAAHVPNPPLQAKYSGERAIEPRTFGFVFDLVPATVAAEDGKVAVLKRYCSNTFSVVTLVAPIDLSAVQDVMLSPSGVKLIRGCVLRSRATAIIHGFVVVLSIALFFRFRKTRRSKGPQ